MQKIFLLAVFCLYSIMIHAQTPAIPDAMNMPDFVKPTPEVSALLKADNLSVNYATGSPNINIPISSIGVNGIEVPINISYNSTGIKVDEYASNVGMGWTCNYGGVISRTVMDKGDENRNNFVPSNFSPVNFSTHNAYLMNFLKNNTDAESDIFSFSFLKYSGKFILDSTTSHVIPLSNYNVVISLVSGNFQDGFKIVTEDGATYVFQDAEDSKSRNPLGSNCPKNYNSTHMKTSWYLTRVTAPNKRSYIRFNYSASDIYYEQSITQYISKCIASDSYSGACAPDHVGYAVTPGTETFYTCVNRQLVTAKFITGIVTSAGDSAAFIYDGTAREDMNGGKRLSQIKVINRNGVLIKQATFYGTYPTGLGSSSYAYSNKRLFLDSMQINDVVNSANTFSYKFQYNNDKNYVAGRLTFAQDLYGYNNGWTGNASLIPILPSTDMNYLKFDSGRRATAVDFGNRSVDTIDAIHGLLQKVIYPTGGYDSIAYIANKYRKDSTTILGGGFSISSISSFSFGNKVLEKSYNYTDSSGIPTSFLLADAVRFSDQLPLLQDGYDCNGIVNCEGLSVTYASVSSNVINPIVNNEGQHLYYRRVTERISGATDNGYTEHHYKFFGGGNIYPTDIMGNRVMAAPFQVVHTFVMGEDTTKIFRYDTATSGYKLQKSTVNFMRFGTAFTTYYNYVVKKNFTPHVTSSPPSSCEFDAFDVAAYAVNCYNIFTDSTKETTYDNSNTAFTNKVIYSYEDSIQSYPVKITSYGSDTIKRETRRKYPLDYSGGIYGKMIARNIVSPVLEEKTYRNDTLLSTVTHTYADWNSDTSVIALQTTEYKEQTNSMPAHINFISYDTLGNPLELAKDSGLHKTYVWGYNKQLPVAVATNAAANEVYYNSFEESGGTADSTAKTGAKSYSGNYSVSFSLPNGKSYTITYWAWNGSAWIYHEAAYTGSTTLTGTKIDEVRIFPGGAQMVTFTYEPLLGMTSQCDVRNQVSYFEYDAMGRLKLVRDADRKIVKLYDYQYKRSTSE